MLFIYFHIEIYNYQYVKIRTHMMYTTIYLYIGIFCQQGKQSLDIILKCVLTTIITNILGKKVGMLCIYDKKKPQKTLPLNDRMTTTIFWSPIIYYAFLKANLCQKIK